ncbi:MAG TPA: glycosyltransferase family 39 protein [Solirubrobacterales bacterium]|nr:glycosyltransferase family 39 protein [Solirubrobacterales bacterium]
MSTVATPCVATEPGLPQGLARPLSRDAVLWALAAIVTAGVAVRFVSLGVQSYHHDEVITAMRVIPGSLQDVLHQVKISESNPPLYYLLAWGWAKAFGSAEFGLRSLSALFGAATVPVGYLIGRQLVSRRTGLILAALVALNPMLIWYSQEARSYSLLVFFSALSMLFFVRALDSRRGRDLALWALASALALCSHYFAIFPIAIEAAWLLFALRERRRVVLPALGAVVATGLALLPLLAAQVNPNHIGWIEGSPLSLRFWETGVSFLAGETGHMIAEPPRDGYALLPVIAVGLALALLAFRGSWREWRGAGIGLALGLGVAALAALAALVGKDYIFERNLLPALVPLLATVAIGFGASRARRTGLALALALCVYWAAFAVYVTQTPNLQRPDLRQLGDVIGPASGRRAVVSWRLAAEPERWYLHDGSVRMWSGVEPLSEIDLVGKHRSAARAVNLPPSFRRVQRVRLDRLTLTRYTSRHPVKVEFHTLAALPTGFGAVGVVLDGPRVAVAAP